MKQGNQAVVAAKSPPERTRTWDPDELANEEAVKSWVSNNSTDEKKAVTRLQDLALNGSEEEDDNDGIKNNNTQAKNTQWPYESEANPCVWHGPKNTRPTAAAKELNERIFDPDFASNSKNNEDSYTFEDNDEEGEENGNEKTNYTHNDDDEDSAIVEESVSSNDDVVDDDDDDEEEEAVDLVDDDESDADSFCEDDDSLHHNHIAVDVTTNHLEAHQGSTIIEGDEAESDSSSTTEEDTAGEMEEVEDDDDSSSEDIMDMDDDDDDGGDAVQNQTVSAAHNSPSFKPSARNRTAVGQNVATASTTDVADAADVTIPTAPATNKYPSPKMADTTTTTNNSNSESQYMTSQDNTRSSRSSTTNSDRHTSSRSKDALGGSTHGGSSQPRTLRSTSSSQQRRSSATSVARSHSSDSIPRPRRSSLSSSTDATDDANQKQRVPSRQRSDRGLQGHIAVAAASVPPTTTTETRVRSSDAVSSSVAPSHLRRSRSSDLSRSCHGQLEAHRPPVRRLARRGDGLSTSTHGPVSHPRAGPSSSRRPAPPRTKSSDGMELVKSGTTTASGEGSSVVIHGARRRDDLGASTLHGKTSVSRIRNKRRPTERRTKPGSSTERGGVDRRDMLKRAMSTTNVKRPEEYRPRGAAASTSAAQHRSSGRSRMLSSRGSADNEVEDETAARAAETAAPHRPASRRRSMSAEKHPESSSRRRGDAVPPKPEPEPSRRGRLQRTYSSESASTANSPRRRDLLILLRQQKTVVEDDLMDKENRRLLHFLMYEHKMGLSVKDLQKKMHQREVEARVQAT